MADNKDKKVLNVPALRFPEFTGEWKFELLDAIAPNITSGKSKPSIGEYNLYGSTGIIGKTATADYSGNMLLVARVGANAGSLQLVNDNCGITDNTLIIKPCKLSSHYLYFYLQHYNLNRLVFGSGQPLITAGMLKKVRIPFGNQLEQRKIERLLVCVNERISTQNKIIEDLKKLMSAISLLLFSECFANDKLVPLKSISNSIKRKNDGQIHPIMMISAEHGFINQSEKYDKDNAGNSLSNYTLLYKGELSYNRGSSKSKKFGSVFSLLIQSALVPHVYHSFCMDESVADCTFYSLLLNSRLLDKELVKVVSSTARMDGLLNISKEDFFSIKVPLPCIDKQRSITNILQKINIKIKREKNIQSLLCLQRKYLLSQMFI